MALYRITGLHTIRGHLPGEIIDLPDLLPDQAIALVQAGHITPVVEIPHPDPEPAPAPAVEPAPVEPAPAPEPPAAAPVETTVSEA